MLENSLVPLAAGHACDRHAGSRDSCGFSRHDVDAASNADHHRAMENRIGELGTAVGDMRERLVRVETLVAHTATSQALEKVAGDLRLAIETQATRSEAMRSDLIKWFVGTATVLAALAFTAARYGPH